jgi:hypothetical protein
MTGPGRPPAPPAAPGAAASSEPTTLFPAVPYDSPSLPLSHVQDVTVTESPPESLRGKFQCCPARRLTVALRLLKVCQ